MCSKMATRSARGWDTPLPTEGKNTINSPIILVPPITPTYNLVYSSHGVIWDNDLFERLMIIFEETNI
jgi:hypothetical protein